MSIVRSNVLDLLRIRSTAYSYKSPVGHWSTSITEHPHLSRFHLVLDGKAWIELPTGERQCLERGDYVIIPKGKEHTISAEAGLNSGVQEAIPTDNFVPDLWTTRGTSNGTQLLCGYFQLDESTPPVILSRLPALLVQRGDTTPQCKKIEALFQLIRIELEGNSRQIQSVLNRLSEVLCLLAVETWIDLSVASDGELSALFDPKLQLVLDQIQSNPMADWTVENLAEIFGQSRTTFATHFKSIMGVGPIRYVTSYRIRLAVQMLDHSTLSIDQIAERVGYSDANTFSRAFKRELGIPPGSIRRSAKG